MELITVNFLSIGSFFMLIFYIISGQCEIKFASATVVQSGIGTSLNSLGTVNNGATSIEKPYFDDINPRNITTVVDDTAILKCTVRNKGERTVSWMRKRDLHILTSNIYTYTGDQRFSVIHPPDSDEWNLKIEFAQTRDSGIYECQVNTEPKINLAIRLNVTGSDSDLYDIDGNLKAARAKILGSQELHVKKGSTISLACVVNVQSSSISWFHGTERVDFDSPRGGISLETEKTEAGTTSRLLLTKAKLSDSGNYTCVPTAAISASIQVHVLNGEHPAAMQTSSAVPCPSHKTVLIISILCSIFNIRLIALNILSNGRTTR